MPILGYSTKGGSQSSFEGWPFASHDMTDADGGNTTQWHCWCRNVSGSSHNIKGGVYTDDVGNDRPEDLEGTQVTINVADGFDGQKDVDYVITLNALTKYWLAWLSILGDHGVTLYWDSAGVGTKGIYINTNWSELAANWGNVGVNVAIEFSIWVDYEVAIGVSLPVLSGDAVHSVNELVVR